MALKPIEIILRAKDEASSVFEGLRSRAATIGVAIAGYFGFTAFSEAVKGAADLEAQLSEVQSVTSATAEDMVRLRTAAEDAGATTKYTATEAATALGNLARAGLDANQAIEALPATLQLAQAGGVDLGRAAEFITKAVMGMGMSFSDAGRVADVLAKGANASNTSVTGLAEALSYAAPVAQTLGLSLEDTVAIIGKFADAGIDASRAGTALNSILSQFADPASTFKRALSDIGITTTDFNVALGQLAAAGPRGQKAIAAVGLEAGPALKALLNQGIGALDELRSKLQGAAGSAAETAAVMNNNLRGSLDGLASAWDTVKNALATPVLPVLKAAADSLTAAL
ncbi:MAG: phage tail tape measure protein, partial [Acidovorax sp.]|nr:phage tail tape measure protein [Acidovorax sp.]